MGAAYSTPVTAIKEHKKVTDEIDDSYMDTVYAAANLKSYLVSKKGGNKREHFVSFHRAFYTLFVHTRYMGGMDKDEDGMIKEIEGWFEDCSHPKFRHIPDPFIRDGIDLFSEYQKKIITKGIITVTR
jgi:hypothetical protein